MPHVALLAVFRIKQAGKTAMIASHSALVCLLLEPALGHSQALCMVMFVALLPAHGSLLLLQVTSPTHEKQASLLEPTLFVPKLEESEERCWVHVVGRMAGDSGRTTSWHMPRLCYQYC